MFEAGKAADGNAPQYADPNQHMAQMHAGMEGHEQVPASNTDMHTTAAVPRSAFSCPGGQNRKL